MPLPIELTSAVSEVVHSDKHLLALGQDATNTKIFKELSELELSLCLSISSVKICPHSGQVLNRAPSGSCLFHLYYSMHREALSSCKVYLRRPTDTAVAVSKTEFVTYTGEPSTYRIICQNSTQEGLQLHGLQMVHVPLGCRAQLPSYLLSTLTNHYFREEIR